MLLTHLRGMYVFGIMITTVAITSYCLDSYPEGSGEVVSTPERASLHHYCTRTNISRKAAWINFARTTGGFIISYFQVTWATAEGTKKSFGIQAGICAFAYCLIIVMQLFGKKMRERAGPLRFKTD